MPLPNMTPTPQSSNIAAVGYDNNTGELYVTFGSGRTYKYLDVPPGEFGLLERADSVGSYFANNIKGQYKTVPI